MMRDGPSWLETRTADSDCVSFWLTLLHKLLSRERCKAKYCKARLCFKSNVNSSTFDAEDHSFFPCGSFVGCGRSSSRQARRMRRTDWWVSIRLRVDLNEIVCRSRRHSHHGDATDARQSAVFVQAASSWRPEDADTKQKEVCS